MRWQWWRAARRATLVAAITMSVLMAAGGRWQTWARAATCGDLSSPFQTLIGCNLTGASIGGVAALGASTLRVVNLNQATISGQAALFAANLRLVNLNQATISGPEALVNANLEGVNLNGATITQSAALIAADLRLVNLSRATIAGQGDLLAANLRGASLHDATISGTGALTGADLSYADLSGATVSGTSALFDAQYSHTICPDGSISDRDGGTCAGHLGVTGAGVQSVATTDDIAHGPAAHGPAGRFSVGGAAVPVGGGGNPPPPPPPPPTTPPLTPPPGQIVSLGGLNLDGYCQAHGYTRSSVNPIVGPGAAFHWYCIGAGSSLINMQNACAFQYPGAGSIAFVQDPNNAYTWVCVVPSSSGGYVETAGGYTAVTLQDSLAVIAPDGTFLAESGSLATGGAVFLKVGPDGTIDYGTPDSGFEVAESGSLATGGAI